MLLTMFTCTVKACTLKLLFYSDASLKALLLESSGFAVEGGRGRSGAAVVSFETAQKRKPKPWLMPSPATRC